MYRGVLVFFGLAVFFAATCTVPAQSPYVPQPGLDIPDSLVIPGRTTYEHVAHGVKESVYFGHAFPVDRGADTVGPASVTTLPAIASKSSYPTSVRHGDLQATRVSARAEHFGNVYAHALHVRDWNGYLASGQGELGGGRGHTSGSLWHREALNARVRRVVTWRSSYDGGLSLQSGRTGVWGMKQTSHHDYYGLGLRGGGELAVFGDHQVSVNASATQRGVSSPELDASEQHMSGRIGWQKTNGRFWLQGRAAVDMVRTDRDAGVTGTAHLMSVSGEAWTRLEENFGLAGGVTVYSIDYLEGDSLRTVRPSFSAWARIMRMKFSARLRSSVEPFGIWEAYHNNQMLDLQTPLRMPFNNVDLDVSGEVLLSGWNTLTGGMQLLLTDDYPVWRRSASGERYQLVLNERARLTSWYCRYQHQFFLGSIDALGIWRQHSLQQSDQPVPFVPDWELHLTLTYPTHFRGVTLSPGLEFIGPRHYFLDTYAELDSYYLLNLDAAVPARHGWQVTVSMRNLLNQSYELYDGISGPGLHVRLGAQKYW